MGKFERPREKEAAERTKEMVVLDENASATPAAQQRLDARKVRDVAVAKRQFSIFEVLCCFLGTIEEFLEVQVERETVDRAKPCFA